jgi:hypothetical protein
LLFWRIVEQPSGNFMKRGFQLSTNKLRRAEQLPQRSYIFWGAVVERAVLAVPGLTEQQSSIEHERSTRRKRLLELGGEGDHLFPHVDGSGIEVSLGWGRGGVCLGWAGPTQQ